MKKIINTKAAPAAIGPYSQGVSFGNLVMTSGQLPLDPTTMAFPEGGVREQTRQSLLNLKAVLEQSGASLDTVLKTTCFLAKMEDSHIPLIIHSLRTVCPTLTKCCMFPAHEYFSYVDQTMEYGRYPVVTRNILNL